MMLTVQPRASPKDLRERDGKHGKINAEREEDLITTQTSFLSLLQLRNFLLHHIRRQVQDEGHQVTAAVAPLHLHLGAEESITLLLKSGVRNLGRNVAYFLTVVPPKCKNVQAPDILRRGLHVEQRDGKRG